MENEIEKAEESAVQITTEAHGHIERLMVDNGIRGLVIKTQAEQEKIVGVLKVVKDSYKVLEDKRVGIVGPVNKLKDKLQALFKPDLEKYKEAERLLKATLGKYYAIEEEKQRKEQKRLQEIAEREERKKREALEKRAQNAEAKGNTGKAEELREEKEIVHAPVAIAPVIAKPKGISTRKTWKGKVLNKALVPDEYKIVDMGMVNKMAQASKGLIKIPGVEIYSEDIISSR